MRWWNRSLTPVPDGGDIFVTDYHNESPVQAVVHAISEIEGCPVENVPELAQYTEPESLNRLIKYAYERDQDVTVKMSVEDYKVAVDSEGTISIRDPESDADSSDSK